MLTERKSDIRSLGVWSQVSTFSPHGVVQTINRCTEDVKMYTMFSAINFLFKQTGKPVKIVCV